MISIDDLKHSANAEKAVSDLEFLLSQLQDCRQYFSNQNQLDGIEEIINNYIDEIEQKGWLHFGWELRQKENEEIKKMIAHNDKEIQKLDKLEINLQKKVDILSQGKTIIETELNKINEVLS